MSEDRTTGTGNNVTKHVPAKRLKAAFRKAKKTNGSLTMKPWARGIAADEPDVAAWFKGKKEARLCNQRARVNIKKSDKKKK